MHRRITGKEFDDALATYTSAAFRLEQQPAYQVSYETAHLAAFLAGDPLPPADMPGFPQWAARIVAHTAAGRIMTRVRIHDVPPTDYQRWLRSIDPHNIAAGEVIRYLPRPDALAAGLEPSLGDWWLLDSARLIVMHYDTAGAPTEKTMTDNPDQIADAIRWRDIAMRLSAAAD